MLPIITLTPHTSCPCILHPQDVRSPILTAVPLQIVSFFRDPGRPQGDAGFWSLKVILQINSKVFISLDCVHDMSPITHPAGRNTKQYWIHTQLNLGPRCWSTVLVCPLCKHLPIYQWLATSYQYQSSFQGHHWTLWRSLVVAVKRSCQHLSLTSH